MLTWARQFASDRLGTAFADDLERLQSKLSALPIYSNPNTIFAHIKITISYYNFLIFYIFIIFNTLSERFFGYQL